MNKFQKLIRCLCTEEMINKGLATKVKANGKTGYLLSYDAGLGFGMWTEDGDDEYELLTHEIEVLEEMIPNDIVDQQRKLLLAYERYARKQTNTKVEEGDLLMIEEFLKSSTQDDKALYDHPAYPNLGVNKTQEEE